jgi:hypothetical protein
VVGAGVCRSSLGGADGFAVGMSVGFVVGTAVGLMVGAGVGPNVVGWAVVGASVC